MGKLTQDEIKWILTIDAKGANKEIAITSSEINKLSQANRMMASDLKAAEKQIKETERAMEKLAATGKKDSEAFQELKATRDMARADMEDYTRKIGENNRAIDENKKKIKELEQGMSLNEMTMKQLKQRAAELQMQLNATSLEANPKAYKELQNELTNVNSRMEFVGMQGKGLISKFAGMNHPVGTAAKSIQGFGQALKVLAANPIGVVIMVIVTAFMALKKAINSSEEASNKFQQIMAPLKLLMDGVLLIVQKIANAFLDLTKAIMDWASKAAEKIPFIGSKMKELNDKAREAIELEKEKQDLRVRERESIVANAGKERDIAELRNKAKQKDIYSNKQIIGFLDEAIKLEKEIAEEKIEQAKISLRLLETEAARTQSTEEVNRKIAEQTALVTQLETEYYNSTRRMESERYSRIDEMRRDDAAKAKEEESKKMELFENNHKEKILALKKQLLEENKTEKWFADESVKLQEQYFSEKIKLHQQYGKSTVDIETEQVDFQLNLQKSADENLLEIINNSRDSMLRSLDEYISIERDKIQDQYDDGIIDRKTYNSEIIELNLYAAHQQLIIVQQYEEQVRDAMFETLEAKKKALDEAVKATKKAAEEESKAWEKSRNDQTSFDEEFQKKRDQALERWDLKSIKDRFLEEMESLNEAFNQGLLTLEEYHQARIKIYADTCKKYAELAVGYADTVSKAVTGYHKLEADSLKAKKQKELKTAGDNAEERQKIEEKYAQKELSLKKRQAGANAAIQIAQATAAAALAIANIWGKHAGNPILAGVLTALSAATTAIQIASIMKQRSAIMATTLDSSSSSSGGGTGSYVVTGRESGGYVDVTREQDKKYYRALLNPKKRGYVDRPTVIVGDGPEGKSKEWVASNDALENPTVAPIIKLLNEAQQAGTIRTIDLNHIMRSRMAGLASGGFLADNPIANAMRNSGTTDPFLYVQKEASNDQEMIRETRDLLADLKKNGLKAFMVYSEFQKSVELLEKSQNIGRK